MCVRSLARRAVPLVTLGAAAAIALSACTAAGASPSAAPSGPAGEPATLEGVSWARTDYAGADGTLVAVADGVTVTAAFTDGTVAGNAGCNRYNGPYTLDGDKITIGNLVTTQMACQEPQAGVETAYLAALVKAATYAISGEGLELSNADGNVVLRYKAVAAASLTTTSWGASGINNGTGGVASIVAGSTVTAVFGDDGTVAGSAGCNTYTGSYTVNGSTIKIGPLASTEKACVDEAVTKQETVFLAAMEKATTFAITGNVLELRDADGALQVAFEVTQP